MHIGNFLVNHGRYLSLDKQVSSKMGNEEARDALVGVPSPMSAEFYTMNGLEALSSMGKAFVLKMKVPTEDVLDENGRVISSTGYLTDKQGNKTILYVQSNTYLPDGSYVQTHDHYNKSGVIASRSIMTVDSSGYKTLTLRQTNTFADGVCTQTVDNFDPSGRVTSRDVYTIDGNNVSTLTQRQENTYADGFCSQTVDVFDELGRILSREIYIIDGNNVAKLTQKQVNTFAEDGSYTQVQTFFDEEGNVIG